MHSLLQFKKLSAKDKRSYLIDFFSNIPDSTSLLVLNSDAELSEDILIMIYTNLLQLRKANMINDIQWQIKNKIIEESWENQAENILKQI